MPRVLITGSSGLIGQELVPRLEADGWSVLRLVRPTSQRSGQNEVLWDPLNRSLDRTALDGLDAVIHLAGESIADGRWTREKKRCIRSSRVDITKFLAETLSRLPAPPKAFISASAIGYYGDRGDEPVDETSTPGTSFLAQVCQEWEAAVAPLTKKGTRTVFIRTGIVLSTKGGALAKMLPPFKIGVGGKIGSGQQFMSWIDLDDEVGAIMHALKTDSLSGPVNAVSPTAVTNAEFTKALGLALSRPTVLPMPAFAAKLAFGEMAEELLLAGARVMPKQLEKTGYDFKYPRLESSLAHLLEG